MFKRTEKIYNDILTLESNKTAVDKLLSSEDMDLLTNEISKYISLKKKQVQSLKDREEFRKEFVGNVAHELKTPLFTIQGYISTLLDGALSDPEVLKKYLNRADKGVDRLIYIVKDLDMITKIEFGESELNKSNFNIFELVSSVFEDLDMKAQKKNISLVFKEKSENISEVYADKERIQQLITNLIVNSIKYGHKNGTTEVDIVNTDEEKILVKISDNGEGIEEEHIPRIFERFYRVDKSGARSEGGSGLGLSIVKHIIDAHDEKIFVESKYGIGSEFSFTLKKFIVD
tara:strand:+ start:208 stop:1071 length:864 start_codon:yes stop_codon:yes gene_type:complete